MLRFGFVLSGMFHPAGGPDPFGSPENDRQAGRQGRELPRFPGPESYGIICFQNIFGRYRGHSMFSAFNSEFIHDHQSFITATSYFMLHISQQ